MDKKQNNEKSFEKSQDLTENLIVERYKFILNEIGHLNENAHKFIALFQTITTAIIGGGVALLASWEKINIGSETALAVLRSLEGLLVLVTLYIVVSIFAIISSWLDFRKEETELLDQMVYPGFRKPPKVKNFWRWNEVYMIAFMVLFIVLVLAYTENQISPLFF